MVSAAEAAISRRKVETASSAFLTAVKVPLICHAMQDFIYLVLKYKIERRWMDGWMDGCKVTFTYSEKLLGGAGECRKGTILGKDLNVSAGVLTEAVKGGDGLGHALDAANLRSGREQATDDLVVVVVVVLVSRWQDDAVKNVEKSRLGLGMGL